MELSTDPDAFMDDYFDFYMDPDALPRTNPTEAPDLQPHGIAQSLQPVESATLLNAGDASQAARARYRTHPRLPDRSVSNTVAPYQISGQLVDASPNDDEVGTLDTEHPQLKRRRTEDGTSSDMAPPSRPSSSTMSMARSSLLSTSTGRSSLVSASTARSSVLSAYTARSSIASIPTPSAPVDPPLVEDEAYDCPVCTMGKGKTPRKKYTKKPQTTTEDNVIGATPESTTQSTARPVKRPNSYKSATWFNTHIEECHLELFRRTNSLEFTCLLCPCGSVMEQTCRARFATMDALLVHLRTTHSHPSKMCVRFDHQCPPLSTRSYPRELYEKWKGRAGSASTMD